MIQKSSEFSPAGLKFCKLRKNRYGGKIVYLDEKVNLQLPFMRAPFGLSSFTNQSTGQTTYSLDLSLDPDDDLKAMFNPLSIFSGVLLKLCARIKSRDSKRGAEPVASVSWCAMNGSSFPLRSKVASVVSSATVESWFNSMGAAG